MTTTAPMVLKKFDPRQKRKGLKAWSSGFLKETKLLEIPDPKIAFCQNLKRITLFPIMPSLSSAIIFVYHHMKSIMEKDRPSSTLWRNNNSHIIENQCGLGIGKHGERGSACWLNVNCTICNYNLYNLLLQFWICSFCIFTSSKINAGWGLGKHGWWKRRWASRLDDSPLLFV